MGLTMATLTKKDLLEAIEDMPEDATIELEIDMWEYKDAISLFCDKDDNVIILSIYSNPC